MENHEQNKLIKVILKVDEIKLLLNIIHDQQIRNIFFKPNENIVPGNYYFNINQIENILDLLSDKLCQVGFDKAWNINITGDKIEDIIDKFNSSKYK